MISSKLHHFGRKLIPFGRSIRITEALRIIVQSEQQIGRHVPTYGLRTGAKLNQSCDHHGGRSILISSSRPTHIPVTRSMVINIYNWRTCKYLGIHGVHISQHFERSGVANKNSIIFFMWHFGKDSGRNSQKIIQRRKRFLIDNDNVLSLRKAKILKCQQTTQSVAIQVGSSSQQNGLTTCP